MVTRPSPRPRTFRLAGLEFDLRATVAFVAATLLLTLERYHDLVPATDSLQALRGAAADSSLYYLLIPLLIIHFGWEFLFRGFLLFSLVAVMGPTAIIAQAVPFALAHLGKPEIETITTIVGGSLFGWVAWRTRSFVYPYLIHLAIYTLTVVLATAFPI